MTKFIIPHPTTTQEIYDRHEGPYSLMVTYTDVLGVARTKHVRKLLVNREMVERDVRGWFEEEGTTSVSVWSEACKYYVTTYGADDVPREAEDSGTRTKVILTRRHRS